MSKVELNKEFFEAALGEVRSRENKLAIISRNLISFFEYMGANPFENHHHVTKCKFASNDAISVEPDNTSLFLYAGRANEPHDEWDTALEINLDSCGKVALYFSGNEFDDFGNDEFQGKVEKFDFDQYSASEAFAKILTIIQAGDCNEFGPHVTATLQKIWEKELHFPYDTAPGYRPDA